MTMKRRFFAAAATAILAACSVMLCAGCGAKAPVELPAQLTMTAGSVSVCGSPAARGDAVASKCSIITGFESVADAKVNGRLVRVRQGSMVTVAYSQDQAAAAVFGVRIGEASFAARGLRTLVSTDAVAIDAAGDAAFDVTYLDGRSVVTVLSGSVALARGGDRATLAGGREITVSINTPRMAPLVRRARDRSVVGNMIEPPITEQLAMGGAEALFVYREGMFLASGGAVVWSGGTIGAPVRDSDGSMYIAAGDAAFRTDAAGRLVWKAAVSGGVRAYELSGNALVVTCALTTDRLEKATGKAAK